MSYVSGMEQIVFSDESREILPHSHHNVHQIFFIMSGKVTVKINETVYTVDRPSAIFVSNFETHSLIAENGKFSRYCISLSPPAVSQELKSDKLASIISNRPTDFCHCIDVESIAPLLSTLLNELLNERNAGHKEFPENASAILRCIFVALYRHSPASFPYDDNGIYSTVQAIKQSIEKDLVSEKTLEELAEEYHVSRYYLAHAYKEVTGYSIKNYRMLCRIAEAKELLVGTSLSVSDICDRVGFPDTSNFSKYFRKKEGYTPSEYRQIHKGEK